MNVAPLRYYALSYSIGCKEILEMLQRLTLKNFKLFDETGVTIEPGKVTVLVGVNGAGKSSVLQALLLLKQSSGQPAVNWNGLLFNGPLINVGSFKDIVHGQDVGRIVEIDFSTRYQDFDISTTTAPHLPSSGTFQYHLALKPVFYEQTVAIGGDQGDKLRASYNPIDSSITPNQVTSADTITITLGASLRIGRPIEVKGYSSSQEQNILAQTTVDKTNKLLDTGIKLLDCFYLVPAMRGFDSQAYELQAANHHMDLSAAGGPEQQAALVANTIAANPDLVDDVTQRLQAILHGAGRLRYRTEQGRLVNEMKSGQASVNLVNEAFGLNQLVAPLLWLGKVPRGATIGIEEPEIHLHPRAQAALCDVFVEVATHEGKQLILTTHSEHILMGLLTAVADGRLKPDDLAVYEFQREGNTARAERLEVNEYGQIAGGLKGFLETDLDEIGELIEARFR